MKSHPGIKFIVFVDDVLFVAQTQRAIQAVYEEFGEFLHSVGLRVNLSKVQQGRFATDVLDFCGYRFAGGYVNISPDKIDAYKKRIVQLALKPGQPFNERAYIKRLNEQIAGFGHYYKCGHVAQTFCRLDGFLRARIREYYHKAGLKYPDNARLAALGLFSLAALHKGEKQQLVPATGYRRAREDRLQAVSPAPVLPREQMEILLSHLGHLGDQNKEIIALLKKQVKLAEKLLEF